MNYALLVSVHAPAKPGEQSYSDIVKNFRII